MIYKIKAKNRLIGDYDYYGETFFIEINDEGPDQSQSYADRAFRWYISNPSRWSILSIESFTELEYVADDTENFDEHTTVSWLPYID